MAFDDPQRPAAVTARVAGWSIRRPFFAIGLWLAFVATAVVMGGLTETRQATAGELGVGESGRAAHLVESADFDQPATDAVLITARGRWDETAARAAAADVRRRLHRLPEVAEIGPPVRSQVAEALLLPVTLAGEPDGSVGIGTVLDGVTAVASDHPDLRVEGVGPRSIGYGVNQVLNRDLGRAGRLSVPVTLAVLLVVFGALVAAGVPLLLGFSAVAAATGLWALASQVVPDIGTVPQVILLIGLAVGVDYSLFYLTRVREERGRGRGTVDAARIAAETSGRAVVISAATSLVALAGLYLAGDAIFAALGTGVILAVAVSMLGSVTALPALLARLGRAVDRPRVPLLWRLTARGGEPRLWPALLAPALRAPRITLLLGLVTLAALAAPALGMSLRHATADDLPRTIAAVRGYDRLLAAFPGQGEAHRVVVAAPAERADAVRSALAGLVRALREDPLFEVDPEPEIRLSADRSVSAMELAYPFPFGAPQAEESLAALRDRLLPEAVGGIPGVEYAVGGELADSVDYTALQSRRLPWVIGFVVLLTVGTMALAFRSVVVALVAGALAMISVAAAFGLLTLVFQHTWAEGLLDFRSTGHIVSWVPLFLFVVLFGLSMDYHVFAVSRIREAVASGLDTRQAVRVGIGRAAGVVTSAAAVMVAVFAIFATLSLVEMKQLGVGLAAAIAIDAVVVRLLLLPSVMIVLGRANWWPAARLPGVTGPGSC